MDLLPRNESQRTWNVANMDSRYLFDARGDDQGYDVDLSEEMEEMREMLYSLLQSEFPSGVVAQHLEKVYTNKYPNGPQLPPNWLTQLTDEFEVENRGPLVMVFARLRKQKVHAPAVVFRSPAVASERSFSEGSTSFIETQRAEMKQEQRKWDRNMMLSLLTPAELAKETNLVEVDKGVDARTYQVLVTTATGPTSFHVRLFDNEPAFDRLRKDIAEEYADSVSKPAEGLLAQLTMEQVVVDGLYAAWMESVYDWHRVVVKEKRSQSDTVVVLFVDHGDVDELPASRLRRITPDLVNTPTFALHCALNDYSVQEPNNQEAALQFNELVFICNEEGVSQARQLTARFLSKNDQTNMFLVDLFMEDGKNIGQTLKGTIDALIDGESPVGMSTPVQQSPSSQALRTPQKELMFEFETPKSERFGRSSTQLDTSIQSDVIVSQKALKPMDVPAAASFPVYVLFAPDPDDFSVRWKGLDPVPDYVKGVLITESVKQPPMNADEPIHPGHYYAAHVAYLAANVENKEWQRVYVSGDAKMDGYLKVFLVDVGCFSVVHRDDIRPLTNAINAVSDMFLIKCKLAGVRPADGSGYWSPVAQKAFRERVSCVNKKGAQTMKVVRVGSESVWSSPDAPGLPMLNVRLIDETDQTDIAQWMVQQGHAVAC